MQIQSYSRWFAIKLSPTYPKRCPWLMIIFLTLGFLQSVDYPIIYNQQGTDNSCCNNNAWLDFRDKTYQHHLLRCSVLNVRMKMNDVSQSYITMILLITYMAYDMFGIQKYTLNEVIQNILHSNMRNLIVSVQLFLGQLEVERWIIQVYVMIVVVYTAQTVMQCSYLLGTP